MRTITSWNLLPFNLFNFLPNPLKNTHTSVKTRLKGEKKSFKKVKFRLFAVEYKTYLALLVVSKKESVSLGNFLLLICWERASTLTNQRAASLEFTYAFVSPLRFAIMRSPLISLGQFCTFKNHVGLPDSTQSGS